MKARGWSSGRRYLPRTRYRLFHKHVLKYVAWPTGRGFITPGTRSIVICELMPMLRLENREWGGTSELPVLELHAVDSAGDVVNVYQLSAYDYAVRAPRAARKLAKRVQRMTQPPTTESAERL